MRRSIAVLLTTLTLAAAVAGCDGGRGSSGFDITENLVIDHVLETGDCVDTDGLRICPSDPEATESATPTPTRTAASPTVTPTSATPGPITATPTPEVPPQPRLTTSLKGVSSVYCLRPELRGKCFFDFSFTALDFPQGSEFLVAVRRAPTSVWELQTVPLRTGESEPPTYRANVEVQADANTTVQVVVLGFFDDTATVQSEFTSLAATGANLAFVHGPLYLVVVGRVPTPTPTRTPIPAGYAAQVTYLGLADADRVPIEPSGVDLAGRPVFVHPGTGGAALVVEGRTGLDRFALGLDGYRDDGEMPDLQVLVSRPLGDGSREVCDIAPAHQGGVPATNPLRFDEIPSVIDALNDLGCRVNDGTGEPRGQIESDQACTRVGGAASFVEPTSTVQFCLPLATAWDFPTGDTVVAARLRDLGGGVGETQEVVIRR